jgi:cytochrome b
MRAGDDSRQGEASDGTEPRHVVVVWDAPTRIFHWLAAVLVAAAYATWRLKWMEWHGRVGSVLLALLFFRLLWGFFGSATARFSGFLASPRTALRHLAQLLRREPDRQVGHNPAGGWMVLLLLALLLGETLTGIYIDNDIVNEGPLTEIVPARIANAIDALHGVFWNALLAAVVLHVAAILLYATVKRHDLLLPMITGRKTLSAGVPQPRMVGLAWAAFLLACSSIAAAALIKYL